MSTGSVKIYRDALVWVLGLIALACLVVSAPATRAIVGLFHDDGTLYGVAASWALLVVLEAGTVAAKLGTLMPGAPMVTLHRVFAIGLLINGASNFIGGYQIGQGRGIEGLALVVGAIVYAALVPGLTALMLHLLCERVRWLQQRPPATVEAQVSAALAPAMFVVSAHRALVREIGQIDASPTLPALTMARPTERYPAPAMVRECPECGSEMTSQEWGALKSAQKRGATWRGCKACRQP